VAHIARVRLVLLVKHQVMPAQTIVARKSFVAHLTRKNGVWILVAVARQLGRFATAFLRRLLGNVNNVVGCD